MEAADRPDWLRVSREVREAIRAGEPVVALESTVVAHGLPRPRNLEVGRELEATIRRGGALPATVGVIEGVPTVGLSAAELELIATGESVAKLSTRDLPLAMARGWMGGTTVAATSFLAGEAGIQVFSTGGIGGVHRGLPPDVSADLTELQRTPIIVICSGAKSILDVQATRELLETLGVLVLGWRSDRFPAFYTGTSGSAVDARVESALEVVQIWRAHRRIGSTGATLLCAPVPARYALAPETIERAIGKALEAAAAEGISGKAITPYLLTKVAEETAGESLLANVELLKNNAAIAAAVATELCSR